MGGLVLQQNIVPHVFLCLLGGIDDPVFVQIGLGDEIRGPGPPKGVKAVVRGGLRGRRALLHAVAESHCPVRKWFGLHLGNGLVLFPGLGFRLVHVPNHAFRRDLVDFVLRPRISLRDGLGGRQFQPDS